MPPQPGTLEAFSPVRGFSTSGRERSERTAAWTAFARDRVLPLQCTPLSADGAVIALRQVDAGGILISEGASNEFVVQRTPADIDAHRSDTVMLALLLHGSAFHHSGGGAIALEPGDALLLDSDVPGVQGYSAESRMLSIRMRRDAYTLRTGETTVPAPLLARRFITVGGSTHNDRRVARLRQALRGTAADGELRDDAIDCILSVRGEDREGAGHVAAARRFILAHLRDQGLSVRHVAQALSVSERQLARAFAAVDATVAATITEMRLTRAVALLRSPAQGARTIGDIAEEVGFGSPSSFAHVFRRHYGHSPSDERLRSTSGVERVTPRASLRAQAGPTPPRTPPPR